MSAVILSFKGRKKRRQTRYKGARSGLYPPDKPKLFVPPEEMWLVHDKAKELGQGTTIGDLAQAICGTLVLFGRKSRSQLARKEKKVAWRIYRWLKMYRKEEWFKNWLLRGKRPNSIRIITLEQARCCRKAWDYMGFCRQIGIDHTLYSHWIRKKFIPNIEWLKNLYGAPGLQESIVVSQESEELEKKCKSCGSLGPDFYRLAPKMRDFREVAEAQWMEQRISRFTILPGFDDWFLDWTMPRAMYGRRLTFQDGKPE